MIVLRAKGGYNIGQRRTEERYQMAAVAIPLFGRAVQEAQGNGLSLAAEVTMLKLLRVAPHNVAWLAATREVDQCEAALEGALPDTPATRQAAEGRGDPWVAECRADGALVAAVEAAVRGGMGLPPLAPEDPDAEEDQALAAAVDAAVEAVLARLSRAATDAQRGGTVGGRRSGRVRAARQRQQSLLAALAAPAAAEELAGPSAADLAGLAPADRDLAEVDAWIAACAEAAE